MSLLKIENLHVEVEDKEILKGVDLELDLGVVNALMGPNGSGKSTLVNTIMGHPKYKITKGKIFFDGFDITQIPVNKRARLGIFLSFQNPREVEGVPIKKFLKTSLKELGRPLGFMDFRKKFKESSEELDFGEEIQKRNLNEGFSGGEKKKLEILQMMMLDPKLVLLDETDSGLDIDSLKIVSEGINSFFNKEKSVLLITHYKRILDYVKPAKVFVLKDGRVVREGGFELVEKLESEGYDFL